MLAKIQPSAAAEVAWISGRDWVAFAAGTVVDRQARSEEVAEEEEGAAAVEVEVNQVSPLADPPCSVQSIVCRFH